MTEGTAGRRQFQFSLRSFLIVTAFLGLLLVLLARFARHREQIRLAQKEAYRSLILEKLYRAELMKRKAAVDSSLDAGDPDGAGIEGSTSSESSDAAVQIERLQRENAELRKTVDQLGREVERLKAR